MTRENSYATLDADGQVPLDQLDNAAGGGPHTHAAADIDTGTLDDARVPAGVARDSEVTTAISDHAAAANPHPTYLTQAEGDAAYDAIGAAAAAAAASQPLDSDLTAITALTTTAFGRALLELADAAALGANHSHAGGSDPFIGSYAPGSFTVPTGDYTNIIQRLILTTTERVTLEGTAQLRID